MNVWKLLSALVVGISTSTLAQAQNLGDLDLTKGILALQCSDVDSLDTPLVFVQGDAGWVLNGSEEVVVTEIADGFRLTTLADPSWMSLVTEERRGDWSVRVLSEIAFTNATCTNIQDLVEILTATMAPRIADNFTEIAKEVAETIPALRAEINRKTSVIDGLQSKIYELQNETSRAQGKYDSLKEVADTIPALKAEITQKTNAIYELQNETSRTQGKYDSLFLSLTNLHRTALRIGAFTEEKGYDTSDNDWSDYEFDFTQSGGNHCFGILLREAEMSEICLIALKKALLPNTD